MQNTGELSQRIKELAAKIGTEQDQGKFTALVEELNRLLDDQLVTKPPKPST